MDYNIEMPVCEESNVSSRLEWLNSIKNAAEGENDGRIRYDPAPRSQRPMAKSIRKVPQTLREKIHDDQFKKYYVPRVVSIGPYHCHNEKLRQMNTFKKIFAWELVSKDQKRLEDLYEELLKIIKLLRGCYEESSTDDFSDVEFTRMMLLDGCFILYFIQRLNEYEEQQLTGMGMKSYQISFVEQDLLLLENQLPFRVLEELTTKLGMGINDWMRHVRWFIRIHNIMDQPWRDIDEILHPAHLLELLHGTMVGSGTAEYEPFLGANWYTVRNVKELIAVGIQLKPSKTSCLTDVHYESRHLSGRLSLPPMTVDNTTKAKFMNLIAYEKCLDISNELWVTSYVYFLDSLIDHADDVKELRRANILRNRIGTDDVVAKLFNEIGTNLVPDPFAYSVVKFGIEMHYTNKRLTYIASQKSEFKKQFCKHPWTILGIIGALLGLFLTGVQTYFQVWSRPTECDQLCKHFKLMNHI